MPKTLTNQTGDGVSSPLIQANIELPDSGQSVKVVGAVQAVGASLVAITGSPVTAPLPPGSGLTGWMIQVHTGTGAASVKSQASTVPVPDVSNVLIYSDVLGPADANLAVDPDSVTPDTY